MPSEALTAEVRLRTKAAGEGGLLQMWFAYLLESEGFEGRRYVGMTSDVKQRLTDHNAGKSAHTSKFVPWRMVTYVAFSDRQKAEAFERYMKSGSGHAFAKKRLW
jgi:putative endonuclease